MFHKIIVKCVPHFRGDWTVTQVPVSDDDVAEDVIIRLAEDLEISPISRHLLSLFEPSSRLWLSPNQKLVPWIVSEESSVFELRVRFKPVDLDLLKRDQAAFDYYFFQIRHDFRRRQKSGSSCDKTQRVLGLFIADIVSYVLETYPHLDQNEAEEKLKEINLKDFVPLPFAQRLLLLSLNAEYKNQMVTAWSNSHQDANTPKQEYIRTLLDGLSESESGDGSEPLWPEYHVEQYSVELAFRPHQLTLLDFQPQTQEIRVREKSSSSSAWSTMCSVEELCFIAVKMATRTVEVSRINGIPHNLTFASESELKSFVSLLDGYYRLSQKWSFSICKDISSPSLTRLKQLKCHGPVGRVFAMKKLKDKSEDRSGIYLMRQSGKNHCDFVIDVCCGRRKFQSLMVKRMASGFTCDSIAEMRTYASLSELVTSITLALDDTSVMKLGTCIPPSENDKSDRLLMCRLKSPAERTPSHQVISSVPVVYSSHSLTCTRVLSNGSKYRVVTDTGKGVVVKSVMSESETMSFLRVVNDWIHLKSDCIIRMRGVLMFPPSVVMTYYPLGPLDDFLVQHQSQLKPVDLIESATYCARGLWYLEEKGLVHGSIRCHNLLVSDYSPSTLKVKLSDPLSNNDRDKDNAWLAPEDRKSGCASESGDVWAFGTTLWEIFCYGKKPVVHEVRDLVQPFGCPTEVWDLIHGCWDAHAEERKQPQGIVRDISQILYEVYNSRRTNCYATLNHTKDDKLLVSKKSNNFVRQLFGSSLSLRSSVMSTSTLLTGLGSSHSDLISLSSATQAETMSPPVNESWLIEANQLSLESGKILGQGCYGEVVKAILTKWCGLETEVVAVKRINQNVPIDAGLRDMEREIEIMKKLSHQNIVEIKGFVEDPQLMLVMEYMELGSLVSYLKVHKHRMLQHRPLPFQKFALDIVEGMKYLESMKIVHRDLAARNILVASDSEVKISDFGLAQVIREGDYYRMRTQQCLPLRWYAPESIMRGTFTHKSDVWSLGVTLWEMYSFGKDPVYPECDQDSQLLQKLEEGKRLECPEDCPLEVYEIMRSCWKASSDERPSFEQLELDIRGISE